MLTRLEHFAVEAMQAMIILARGSSISDEFLAQRAFQIATAMEVEAGKHNPADRAQRAAQAQSDKVAEQIRAQQASDLAQHPWAIAPEA